MVSSGPIYHSRRFTARTFYRYALIFIWQNSFWKLFELQYPDRITKVSDLVISKQTFWEKVSTTSQRDFMQLQHWKLLLLDGCIQLLYQCSTAILKFYKSISRFHINKTQDSIDKRHFFTRLLIFSENDPFSKYFTLQKTFYWM